MAAKTESAGINLYINTKGAEASMKNLRDDARKLKNELSNLSETDPKFKELSGNLQRVNGRLEEMDMKVKGTSKTWEFLKSQVAQFGILAAGFLGFQMLIGQVDNLVRSNYKLSDSLADIRKTTGLTEKEVDSLNKQLGKINTRTATSELRDMAVVAGQLGYSSKKDVLEFVKAMDTLNVALGDEFGGGVEQLSKEFGALGRNFKEFDNQNPSDTILKLGNAVNELSASGAATGPVMTDFANRIGGVGGAMGFSAGETLGLSATLEELNITAERGGTAVGKILQKMTTNVSEFAQIAGIEVDDFQKMLNTDLYGAFVKVVEGSQKSGNSATALAKVLKDAELQGSGASDVFLKLGKNTDLLSQRVDLANQSLTNTNSITNEFNIKNNNFAANVDKIGKAFAGWFVNGAVMDGLNSFVALLAKAVEPVQDLSEGLREEEAALKASQIEMNAYFSILKDSTASTAEKSIAMKTLNEKYGEYLPHLITEKTSLTDLNQLQSQANDLLIKKIVLKSKEADLTEITNKRIADEKELIRRENELVEYKVKERTTVDPNVKNYIEYLKDRTEYLKAEIEKSKVAVQSVDKEYADLKKKMGIVDEAPVASESKEGDKDKDKKSPGLSDEQKAAIKKKQEEEAKLDADFNAQVDAQKEALAQKKEDDDRQEYERIMAARKSKAEKDFSDHLNQIQLDAETEKLVAEQNFQASSAQKQEWMQNDAVSMFEMEQARAQSVYEIERQAVEDTLALYNDQNDQTGQIRQNLNNRLLALDNGQRRAEIEGEKEKMRLKQAMRERDFAAASSIIGSFGKLNAAFLSLAGGDQSEFLAFQKGITLAQIAVDTARAISALSANSASNPANSVTFGAAGAAQFAAGLATILSNVAQAKQLLSSSNEPSAPNFGGGSTASTSVPAYATGGFNSAAIANPGGYYDKPGMFIAAEEGGEWIAPNWMIKDPNYKGIFNALEYERVNKFASGGFSSPTSTSSSLGFQSDNTQVVGAIMSLHATLDGLADKINEKQVLFSQFEYDKSQDLNVEIKASAQLGN